MISLLLQKRRVGQQRDLVQPQEGGEGRASKLWCFLWGSLQLTASAVCPCSLCLPQLCQTGEEEQDTNLAKHL